MMNPLSSINELNTLSPLRPEAPSGGGPAATPEVDFAGLLQQAIEQTSDVEAQSQQAIEQLLAGEDITRAEVFTAVKKADLTLRMMMQVRNKILEAYDEVKQMRI